MIVESDRNGLSNQDKLFILRQYRLNLERELIRTISSIKETRRSESRRTCCLRGEQP